MRATTTDDASLVANKPLVLKTRGPRIRVSTGARHRPSDCQCSDHENNGRDGTSNLKRRAHCCPKRMEQYPASTRVGGNSGD